jgi:hypothetical protein
MVEESYRAVMVGPEVHMVNVDPHAAAARPLPQSTVQLIGQTSSDVVSGISKTPLMLGVITLNLVGVIAAVYFLNLLINGQQAHLANLLRLQTEHLKTIIDTHNREFDALMLMNAKVTDALQTANTSPPTPTPQPPAATAPGRSR